MPLPRITPEFRQRPHPCVACGRSTPVDGPDPCLGYIPGVVFACCGHNTLELGGDEYWADSWVDTSLDGEPFVTSSLGSACVFDSAYIVLADGVTYRRDDARYLFDLWRGTS